MKLSDKKYERIAYWFVLLSFILPIIYLIYRIAVISSADSGEIGVRSRADYYLMLVQCLLGVVVIHVPQFYGSI